MRLDRSTRMASVRYIFALGRGINRKIVNWVVLVLYMPPFYTESTYGSEAHESLAAFLERCSVRPDAKSQTWPRRSLRFFMAFSTRTSVLSPEPHNIRISVLHRVQECDEYGAAQWCTFLVAGLCPPLRAGHITTPDLVDLSRRTFARALVGCRPTGCADVVPAGSFFERLIEGLTGCCFLEAGATRTWCSVR